MKETEVDQQPVVLISGAAQGIGWSCAQLFAKKKYRVVLLDRDPTVEQRAVELGSQHVALVADITDETSVAQAMSQLDSYELPLNCLVNNAGIGEQPGKTSEQTVSGFNKVIQTHLNGCFLLSQYAGKKMEQQGGGSIVNLSSIAAFAGLPARNAYVAAKAGISAMTRAMASEWGAKGIRVNAVAPGYVYTEIVKKLEQEQRLDLEGICTRTPLGRLGTTEEIAQAIYFLASDQASYITGTTLMVDGGWLVSGNV